MIEDLIRYCQPQGPLPKVERSGSILVIGSAVCVEDDLERYDHLHHGDRMAVNDAIPWYAGGLNHAASLHSEKLKAWTSDRKENLTIHSARQYEGFPGTIWPIHADGGTSGLFGVIISLLMGYDSIILAGIPNDLSSHFNDPQPAKLCGTPACDQEWMIFSKFFDGKVKSLSGRTMEWFGVPA